MLALRDLPHREHLENLKREFPQLDIRRMETYIALLNTATELVRRIDAYLHTQGLQQNRFFILVVLYRDPAKPLPAATLAASIGVRPPTLTGLLAGLNRKKLTRRLSDPSDRRGILVQITPAGEAFLRSVLPGYYAIINEAFAPLRRADEAALQALLEKILI